MRASVKSSIYEDLKILKCDIQTIKELTAQIDEICYKLTASYGVNAGGGGGGLPSSQIERLIEKKDRLLTQKNELETKVRAYNSAIATVLTPLEREIVYQIIDGNKLSWYARQKGIYKSTVYKISDRAIYKIAMYIERS